MTVQLTFTHEEVGELAGLYVLDALEPAERRAFDAHLAACDLEHAEIAELGGVVPALASTVEPLDAPPQLKARVLAAVQREAAPAGATHVKPWTIAFPAPAPAARAGRSSGWLPAWTMWAPALAAVLILAVVGVWAVGLQGQAQRADARAVALAQAIEAFSAPGSATAVLRPTGAQSAASGFAAVAADGTAYVVVVGLPAAPADRSYQGWYIVDGTPVSAGLMTPDADGYMVAVDPQPVAGTQVIALTVEPRGGSVSPTTDPFVVGELRRA